MLLRDSLLLHREQTLHSQLEEEEQRNYSGRNLTLTQYKLVKEVRELNPCSLSGARSQTTIVHQNKLSALCLLPPAFPINQDQVTVPAERKQLLVPLESESQTPTTLLEVKDAAFSDLMLPQLWASESADSFEDKKHNPTATDEIVKTLPATSLQQPQVTILTPTAEAILDVPATTVILQYTIGTEVELRVNGEVVDKSLIGRTETDTQTNLITQTWYGVALSEGENTLTVNTLGNENSEPLASVAVQVRGAPQELKLETFEAGIPADGRSTATIKGQLLDESGNRSHRDAIVTLVSNAGEFVGADYEPDQPGFQVKAKAGEFTATLRSGMEAKTARIRATTSSLEAFTQMQFDTALRPNLLSGVINLRWGRRGTDFFDRFEDFLPADEDYDTELNFSSAVFATGSIGEWSFTGAFNSDRSLNEDCNCDNRLFRTYQGSEQNYPVYGDSSTVEVVAPSIDQFYLRLERSTKITGAKPDYAMWGDYNTDEFATASQQFTATTRQLHGFKANYNLGNLQISAFYGNNIEGFQRDTIVPDGTSGFYFLSRRLLLAGSEDVFIELEELDNPGTVVRRERLRRGPDYEIDYDRGTLLFRDPVLRTDLDQEGRILVRRIVATYQFEDEGGDTNIYAGRVRYHFSREVNRESWIGATYLQEDRGTRNFELYGADAFISLGENGHLIAEYAHSRNDSEVLGEVNGSAYRLQAEGEIAKSISGRAYFSSTDTGFANNATVSFVPGQTRYGVDLRARLSETTKLRLQFDRQENEGLAPQVFTSFGDLFEPRTDPIPGNRVDNSLTTISAGVTQNIGKSTLDLDWIYRDRDDRIGSLNSTSSQLRSRLSVPLTRTLTLRAQNELTLSDQTDAVNSDRTTLGLDWEIHPGITLSVAQQWFTRGQFEGQSITSLGINGDYKLGSDTTLTGRYMVLGGTNEITSQGAIGIKQGWTIAPGLKLDFAYEHVFGNFFERSGAGERFRQPFAFGQGASALSFASGDSYSVGISYTDNPDFKANARFEHRSSSRGSNTVISASATGKISPALTALLSYNQASSSNQRLRDLGDTARLRLGLAYRDPNDDRFNALLRYEYRKNPATIPDTLLLGSGTGSREHVFAAEAIYAPNWRWEFYGKYAFRHSKSFLASDLIETSAIHLGQIRAIYRLGYNFDLVGEVRWINQPSANYNEIGFLVELGYYLTPDLRLYAGYSLGDIDDPDFSGSRSADGPYLGISVKLNDLFNSFGQPTAPPQQQESLVQPVAQE
ncbi:MAG: TonB-dependent receptor [Symploca sp. SIO3C6]|nr:TonB-dependent receptor [Symploca sp. SIO3C6]